MSTLDVIIAIFLLLAVVRGARTGFLAGAFSLVGVVLGASVGSRLAPALLPDEGSPVFGAGITLVSIVGFAVLGEVLARMIGGSLRDRLRSPASTALDGIGGAALGLALSLTLVWVVGAFALQTPLLSSLYPAVNDSRILYALNQRAPSQLFAQAVAELDPLPQIRGPRADVAIPDAEITGDPEVLAATSGMVRVNGIACGYGVEGSGWVAAPDLIVTNAHVVAGQTTTRIQYGEAGLYIPADVVLFDPENDIAVLRVNGLGLPSLPLAEPETGEAVAVLGFPGNGPLSAQPGRTGETQPVISGDAYNQGPVERTVTSFRVHVEPGNSGGPAVNADGEAVATIFASRADSESSGYGVPSQIVGQLVNLAAVQTAPVSTGGCAN